jgi:hypothetical protein
MADYRLTLYVEGSDVDVEALRELLADNDRRAELMENIATLLAQKSGGDRRYQVEMPSRRLVLPVLPGWPDIADELW